MPRRKIKLEDISVEDAFAALEMQGINVQVKAVTEPTVEEPVSIIQHQKPVQVYPQKLGNSTVKVTLYAKHSVGSGGTLVGTKDDRHVEESSYATYGPGICYVPSSIAVHLLHQDALAKYGDERMLDRNPRCYIIAQRINHDGQRANVGIQVSEGAFGDFGQLPDNMQYIL